MRDKTKRDKTIIVCGYGLLLDSIFILIMFAVAIIQGVIAKLPDNKPIELTILVWTGGLSMAIIGYWLLKKEYDKPILREDKQ